MPASSLATLAIQVTYHQVAMGMAYVHSAFAQASYSFASSVGTITVTGTMAMPGPSLTVRYPPAYLVSQGAAGQNLSPAFGQPPRAGDLLLAWVFSNSSSPAFDTVCGDPSWTLITWQGGAYSWVSLWRKTAQGGDIAPAFTTGASTPLSQLLEFTGAGGLDQSGTGAEGSDPRIVTLACGSPDTASGDLVFGVAVWPGANPTPATLTLAGTDSGGMTLPLSVTSNAGAPGQIPWAAGWAQASAPAGPGVSTITGTSSIFDYGTGVIASFRAAAGTPAAGIGYMMRMIG